MISVKKFRQQKKKPTIETANNLDGSPEQYAKWKKPVLEGEMLRSPCVYNILNMTKCGHREQ